MEKTTKTVPSSAPISLLTSKESMRQRLPYPAGHMTGNVACLTARESRPLGPLKSREN